MVTAPLERQVVLAETTERNADFLSLYYKEAVIGRCPRGGETLLQAGGHLRGKEGYGEREVTVLLVCFSGTFACLMVSRCQSVFLSWDKDDTLTFVLGSVEATLRLASWARTCKCSRFFCIDAGAELALLSNFPGLECVSHVTLALWERWHP